jgi:hypothetical protein
VSLALQFAQLYQTETHSIAARQRSAQLSGGFTKTSLGCEAAPRIG